MPVQYLQDHFRCPEEMVHGFTESQLSQHRGFFRIGSNLCYGRVRDGITLSAASNIDAFSAYTAGEGVLGFNFDPDEIIDNFRLERYPHPEVSGFERLLKKIYYEIRPWTTPGIRREIQRLHAHNWRKLSFPRWPLDTTVESVFRELLKQIMVARNLEKVPFIWYWPNGCSACVLMTHDVETHVGRDFCSQLMDLDESGRIPASFQIVPEDRYEVPSSLLDEIRARTFEIAVQDLNHDGRLFDSEEEFMARVPLINEYGKKFDARGFRAGVLYRKPEWMAALEFSYDMSFPNVAHLDPQRGGCCSVFPYFIGNLVELPVTTTQDYTLFYLLDQRSIALWQEQITKILSHNGLMSFIVHPDYVVEPSTRAVYCELLNYLNQLRTNENLWFCLPREADEWWRARNKMLLKRDGTTWRIEGPGSEHAVLATAELVNGELVYKIGQPALAS
jgi:hypothetical protein